MLFKRVAYAKQGDTLAWWQLVASKKDLEYHVFDGDVFGKILAQEGINAYFARPTNKAEFSFSRVADQNLVCSDFFRRIAAYALTTFRPERTLAALYHATC